MTLEELRSLWRRERQGQRRKAALRKTEARIRRVESTIANAKAKGLQPTAKTWPRRLRQKLIWKVWYEKQKRILTPERLARIERARAVRKAARRDLETKRRMLRRHCEQVGLTLINRNGRAFVLKPPRKTLRTARDAIFYGSIFECEVWLRQTYALSTWSDARREACENGQTPYTAEAQIKTLDASAPTTGAAIAGDATAAS